MANYISNVVIVNGENQKKKELKQFLDKYSKAINDEGLVDLSNSILKSNLRWFYYSWNGIGSKFFDIDKLESDTLYFHTRWISALSDIVEMSKLFSDIEFHLKWNPRQFGDLDFGVATIKSGEILSLSNEIPQAYLDELEECLVEDDDFSIENSDEHSKELILNDNKLPFLN